MTDGISANSRRQRLSAEDWAALLTARFFPIREIPGPVYLAVDDDALDELADAERGDGAQALASAVRPSLRLGDPRHLFDDVTAAAYRWAGNGRLGPPPFLPCLALCVLAASRMDASETTSSTNYYSRLKSSLGLEMSPASGYPDAVPALFRLLREWLGIERGRRGVSTIPESPTPAHIGFALSQIHVRESDRRKLTRFFSLLTLKPSDAGSAHELVGALRTWARRSDLSSGAKAFIAADSNRVAVSGLLASELREWDETERDERGRRLGRVQLLLEIKGTVRWGVLVTRPDGFPASGVFMSADGLALDLHSSIAGFYDPVWFEQDSALLAGALRAVLLLRSGQIGLRFAVDEVTALGPDPRTGRLAVVKRVEPGERHWVLVHLNLRAEVLALVEKIAREGWSEARGAPDGWLLLRDVIVDMPPPFVVSETLSTLVPAVDARPELNGGLSFGRLDGVSTYLRGGEPDLWIPEWLAGNPALQVMLDGNELPSSGATRIELSRIPLDPGVHAVEVGSARMRFRLLDNLLDVPPSATDVCRIVARPVTGDTVSVPRGTEPEGQWVCGAIASAGSDIEDEDKKPILLPYGARRYVILGSRIGQFAECQSPARPGWLEEVGLLPQDFEVYPKFDAAWAMMEWSYSGWEARMVGPSRPVEAVEYSDLAIEWASAVAIDARVDSPGNHAAWLEYLASANAILEGEGE